MERTNKILLIIGLLYLPFSLLSITPIPLEYSISIYSQVPSAVVIYSIIIVIVSIPFTIEGFGTEDDQWTNLLPVYLVLMVSILLPYLLGYSVRYGDPMIKLGNIRDLLIGNALSKGLTALDKYPFLHFEISELSIVLGQPPKMIVGYIFILFSMIYIFAAVATGRRYGVPPAATLLFIPLVFSHSMRPVSPTSFTYLTTLPLLLFSCYLMQSEGEARWGIIFILLGITLWLQHLFIALLFIIVFLAIQFLWNTNRVRLGKTIQISQIPFVPIIIYSLFGYIWFAYSWGSLFYDMVLTTGALFEILPTPSEGSASVVPGGGFSYLFDVLNLSITDVVQIIIQQFGGLLILLSIAGLGCIWYLFRWNSKGEHHYILPVTFVVGGIWAVAELTVGIIPSITGVRILRFSAIASPVLAGWFFHQLYTILDNRGGKYQTYMKIAFSLVIIAGVLLTVSSMYSSPSTLGGNGFTVDSGNEGWEWYFNYADPKNPTMALGQISARYAELCLSPREETRWIERNNMSLFAPPHFQTPSGGLSDKYDGLYYISVEKSRMMNLDVGYTGDFTKREIYTLRYQNPNSNLVYNNGNMNISYIN